MAKANLWKRIMTSKLFQIGRTHMKRLTVTFVSLLLIAPASQLGLGDINRDGKVTATDLVQLRQMVEGDRPKSGRADLNGDGSIDQIDLQILRERLAGK